MFTHQDESKAVCICELNIILIRIRLSSHLLKPQKLRLYQTYQEETLLPSLSYVFTYECQISIIICIDTQVCPA